MTGVTVLHLALLTAITVPLLYFYILGAASFRRRKGEYAQALPRPRHRFALTIAAHDEAAVIADTVRRLRALDYPTALFDIHVVADFCSDATAALARQAGASAHERHDGPRGGKGAALSWLFQRLLADSTYDAVIVFDADTQVDAAFLQVMDAYLSKGHSVVQGQHVIGNPEAGLFPALTEAKFLIDNQVQNFGRTRLGLSAKNMGDCICLRADVLRAVGWGSGLTEDYQLRQKLLLAGHRLVYAPEAIGKGEAPPTWKQARVQRLRWMKGANEVSRSFRRELLRQGLATRNLAVLDAGFESYLPTFSTLALTSAVLLLSQLLLGEFTWAAYYALHLTALVAYPLLALFSAHAPLRSYVGLAFGPVFIIWRAKAALSLRLFKTEVRWVRTQHGKAPA